MSWVRALGRDVRAALHSILSVPMLSIVVVVSLAVGIGVNTVVFAWLQHRLLQPLPGVASSASLHLVEPRTENGLYPGASWLEFQDLRERLGSFQDLLAFRASPLYIGESGSVERAYGLLVSDNYFEALDLRPALGRFLQPEEVRTSGASAVAVISYGLWQARYGGSADALGRSVRVNGRDLTIIGVAPEPFQGTILGLNFEVWVPATAAPLVASGSRELEQRSARGYALMGRLQPGTTRERAQAELDVAMQGLARAYPETNATMRGEVLPFWQSPRGPQRTMAYAIVALQGLMLLLLLAVCGNIANLVLARAGARQKEFGVRIALGAGPWRIASLLLTEHVVLALAGALLAIPIAIWGTYTFRLLPVSGLPIRFQTDVDVFGWLFAALLGAGSGLLVGAAPALQLSRIDPVAAFRSAAKTAARSRLRNGLMAIQVGLALVVLLAAGLFFRRFMETRDTDPGFRREGVLLAAYDLTGRNASAEYVRTFPQRLLDRVRDLPGVEAAAISAAVPLDIHGLPSRVFTVDGYTRIEPGFDRALANTVTPGYLQMMEIPLRAGVDFAPLGDAGAPPQVIVNEAFVQRYLRGLEPLGRSLRARGRTYVIVGVARDSLYNAFGEPPTPLVYFSYRDNPGALGELHVRTRPGRELAIVPDIRRAVRDLDADLPLFNVRTFDGHVEANLIFRRVPAKVFMVLAPLLLLLAAIGIYAVVAYTVTLRTTELGVRLALGATPRRLVAECVGENMTIILVGAIAGWLLAFVVAINVLVDGPVGVGVFAGVPALLLAVAAVACWLPARRAAALDPWRVLRQE